MSKWINRAAQLLARNGTTTATLTIPATTSGNLLLLVAASSTIWSVSGWTERVAPTGLTSIAAYTKTAGAGETSVVVTLTDSDCPVGIAVYEFLAGTTWVSGLASESNSYDISSGPNLTGLTGTNLLIGAYCQDQGSGASGASIAWSLPAGITEDLDVHVGATGTDGVLFGVAYVEDSAASAFDPTSQSENPTGGTSSERLTLAVNVTSVTLAYARPDADTTVTGWSDQAGGTTNLYTMIDEESPDTADYVKATS